MTGYSRYRSYPGPSSDREGGNGGLHSELLARSVAVDLDALDAAWPKEVVKSTVILTRAATQTGLIANDPNFIDLNTVDAFSVGGEPGLYTGVAQGLGVVAGGEGWYHIKGSAQGTASGTVTAGAHHRLELRVQDFTRSGYFPEVYYGHSQQQGAVNSVFTNVEAFVYLNTSRAVYLYYFHTNVGSTLNVPATALYLSGSKVMGVV